MSDDSDASPPLEPPPSSRWTVPHGDFTPARILVNPRCATTYAGVSRAQLALDFVRSRYKEGSDFARVFEEWGQIPFGGLGGAPDSFVCQEQ
ncbi:Cryptococcal mannosyltransferase 1, partial [Tulasnella sp. 425]